MKQKMNLSIMIIIGLSLFIFSNTLKTQYRKLKPVSCQALTLAVTSCEHGDEICILYKARRYNNKCPQLAESLRKAVSKTKNIKSHVKSKGAQLTKDAKDKLRSEKLVAALSPLRKAARNCQSARKLFLQISTTIKAVKKKPELASRLIKTIKNMGNKNVYANRVAKKLNKESKKNITKKSKKSVSRKVSKNKVKAKLSPQEKKIKQKFQKNISSINKEGQSYMKEAEEAAKKAISTGNPNDVKSAKKLAEKAKKAFLNVKNLNKQMKNEIKKLIFLQKKAKLKSKKIEKVSKKANKLKTKANKASKKAFKKGNTQSKLQAKKASRTARKVSKTAESKILKRKYTRETLKKMIKEKEKIVESLKLQSDELRKKGKALLEKQNISDEEYKKASSLLSKAREVRQKARKEQKILDDAESKYKALCKLNIHQLRRKADNLYSKIDELRINANKRSRYAAKMLIRSKKTKSKIDIEEAQESLKDAMQLAKKASKSMKKLAKTLKKLYKSERKEAKKIYKRLKRKLKKACKEDKPDLREMISSALEKIKKWNDKIIEVKALRENFILRGKAIKAAARQAAQGIVPRKVDVIKIRQKAFKRQDNKRKNIKNKIINLRVEAKILKEKGEKLLKKGTQTGEKKYFAMSDIALARSNKLFKKVKNLKIKLKDHLKKLKSMRLSFVNKIKNKAEKARKAAIKASKIANRSKNAADLEISSELREKANKLIRIAKREEKEMKYYFKKLIRNEKYDNLSRKAREFKRAARKALNKASKSGNPEDFKIAQDLAEKALLAQMDANKPPEIENFNLSNCPDKIMAITPKRCDPFNGAYSFKKFYNIAIKLAPSIKDSSSKKKV